MSSRHRSASCYALMAALIAPFAQNITARPVRDATASAPSPVWRVNLESLGYVPRTSCPTDLLIAFLSDKVLLAIFPVSDALHPQPYPADSGCSELLRAITFDTETGHALKKRDLRPAWSGLNLHFPPELRLYAASKGRFIVRRGTQLDLYSSDLDPLQSLKLPRLGAHFENWQTMVSPSGRAFYALHSFNDGTELRTLHTLSAKGAPTYTYRTERIRRVKYRIDPDTLRFLFSWEDYRRVDSVADNTLAVADSIGPDSDSGQAVFVEEAGRPLWLNIYHRLLNGWPGRPTLLDDHTILLPAHGVQVMTTDGRQIFADHKFGWHEALSSHVLLSADARRFGVAATVEKLPFLEDFYVDVSSRLLIYDVASRSRVYTLKLDMPLAMGDGWYHQAACLSRDSSMLAYAALGSLRAYVLPHPTPGQTH